MEREYFSMELVVVLKFIEYLIFSIFLFILFKNMSVLVPHPFLIKQVENSPMDTTLMLSQHVPFCIVELLSHQDFFYP